MHTTAATRSRGRSGVSTPRVSLLGRGDYRVLVTAAGTGGAWLGADALTAWSGESLEDREGAFVYVRDLDSGVMWSAGHQPVGAAADRYEAGATENGFAIARVDGDVETRLEVLVPGAEALEVRRVVLANRGAAIRRLEVTSYAEVVLQPAAAHFGHPEFSRLFVQTEWVDEHVALLARRRPRDPDTRHPWLLHTILEGGPASWETDRARFVGRGRDRSAPLALATPGPLSGTVGNVLDPIVSLRRVVELEPGASATVTFLFAADHDRERTLAIAARWRAGERIAAAPAEELVGEEAVLERIGLDAERWARLEAANEPPCVARPAAANRDGHAAPGANADEPLQCWNGTGGFTADGRAYVVRLTHRDGERLRLPPRPWVNVIANESFGTIVSETGAGPTWFGNSRTHRLTPWSNDPLIDPHGEALLLRDESSGERWSPLPGPRPAAADHEARHGLGWTTFRHASHDLEHEATVFVARREPLKLVRLKLTNRGAARTLALFAYHRLVLGTRPEDSADTIVTEIAFADGVMLARNPASEEYGDVVAFVALAAPPEADVSFSCDRTAFIGRHGGPEDPAATRVGAPLDGRAGAATDPCFAARAELRLAAGETVEVTVLLGAAPSCDAALDLVRRHRAPGAVAAALAEASGFWDDACAALRVETGRPALDLVANGWLLYQTLSCRLWARSALYQSGGAFGYRDQLQDAGALAWFDPALLRAQIVLHAGQQFLPGDVLHWWHPPLGRGLRTRFADDRLWLPLATAEYLRRTGDTSVLDESAPFLVAPELGPGEDEAYLLPETGAEIASVYEHACRAIDRSLDVGAHGLPLFGAGDWNDGMNRVGRAGRGESVWMAFFLDVVIAGFLPWAERRGDRERVERWRAARAAFRAAVEREAWDGEWYRRGYYDDGAPLGSRDSDECRIDALVQAWAVLSGAAPAERAASAMDAVERELIAEDDGLLRLLAPPFEHTPHDPGYIRGYVPGVRENGGQYTHAALWVVRALAEMGRSDRAARLLEMLSPVSHTATPAAVERYGLEPYVIAADVYGARPFVGRGGWSWYTGSSGWMLRVLLESILGLDVEGGDTLAVRPRIPASWPGYRVRLRLPNGATVAIAVTRRGGGEAVREARLDGAAVALENGVARFLTTPGRTHAIDVVVG